ncbi:phosphomutase-like protein 3 [[Candida] jaroonii]|uniref:Phosphomutase-like protein 3 n=1 Tax=[Candida] jaroonii TaxID=467808 RepID=A0ACA9YFW7_9ASCO|nr:phosphomutase-like protein 3 [[Candida] jaroonii]
MKSHHGSTKSSRRILTMLQSLLLVIAFIHLITGQVLPRKSETDIEPPSYKVPSKYKSVEGYFQQTDDDIGDSDPQSIFNIKNFGLNSKYQWSDIPGILDDLNDGDDIYKLLFLARHGEGYHNIAPTLYSDQEWECTYQMQDGDASKGITWFDAELTDNGIAEIEKLASLWKSQINDQKTPIPSSFYVSPLSRTLHTYQLTWSSIVDSSSNPPTVKEYARETYGLGTESKRHPKSYITSNFPFAKFEDGFSEQDVLWVSNKHESKQHRNYRANLLLNDIFINDKNSIISITAHSGLIASILKVVDHQKYPLATGEVVPVLIKASNIKKFDMPDLDKAWKTLSDYCDSA